MGTSGRETFVVGICGGSAAGKTTVADLLRKTIAPHCAVAVIPVDSYFRDHSTLSPAEQDRVNYDEPAALDFGALAENIRRLKGGDAFRLPRYDYAAHASHPDGDWVEPAPLVLVEGILLFHPPELQPLLDYRLFVEAQRDERLRRRIARDVAERGRTAEQVVAQFTTTVEPGFERYIAPTRERADHRLDWNDYNHAAITSLGATLREKC